MASEDGYATLKRDGDHHVEPSDAPAHPAHPAHPAASALEDMHELLEEPVEEELEMVSENFTKQNYKPRSRRSSIYPAAMKRSSSVLSVLLTFRIVN